HEDQSEVATLPAVTVAEGLTKRVVVKRIRREFADQPEFCRMFVDEAKIALGLNHANIVQVFDFGQVRGELYLAMELVEGVDLMRLVQVVHDRGERIPTVIAAYIAHQAAAGLSYAHQKRDDFGAPIGIVHRDISPHNVMLSFAGTVKILDFGIARPVSRAHAPLPRLPAADPALADAMTIQGKVAYMSPEQAMGRRVDPRSDVYSLGVVLYEMLAGRLVFRGKSVTTLLEEVRAVPLPPLLEVAPATPPELAAVVDRALARDPEHRWETARALQSALATFLHRADPVVDDEVLSHYVTRYFPARSMPLEERPLADDEATRELGESAADRLALAPHRESRPVVLLRAVLVPQPVLAGEPPPDPSRFLEIARGIAYKPGAQVCAADADGLLFAFGVVAVEAGSAEQAVRVARALREAIGDAAPGVGIGVALAEVLLTVHRRAGAPTHLEIDPALDRHLASIAAAAVDGPVMIAGDLADQLRPTWRLGEPRSVDDESPLLGPWGQGLDQAAPLLGPAHAADPRIHHAPGARAVLYGRELELKALRDAFAEAIRARSTRAVMIVGGPGLGKRTLVERFVAAV
ncbi:MAG TPA: protein kinase, partial [Nannocystaceae bacterium]|nr:protein kinase [Nannocystaceae bacterium]